VRGKLLNERIRRVISPWAEWLAADGKRQHGDVPFQHEDVDSTGAGDAFTAACTFLERTAGAGAVRRANLYRRISTTGVGTKKSFYDRARFDGRWRQEQRLSPCLALS